MLPRRTALLLAVPVALVLLGYVVWPSLSTFLLGLDAAVLKEVFGRPGAAGLRGLVNSTLLSLASAAGAVVLGGGLAWALWRYALPLRRTLAAVAVMPLALPPLVGVLAFLFLYGESGVVPRALQGLVGSEDVPFSFEGVGAVWLVHLYAFYVYPYLFAAAALARLDRSLLDASADLGASPWRTLRSVVLPQLRPALAGAALLVFMLSMASFTAPFLFAEDTPFLTVQVFQFKTNGFLDRSAAVASVLTLVCVAFLLLVERGPQPGGGGGSGKGAGAAAKPLKAGWARVAALGGVLTVLAFVLLPVLAVAGLSFAETARWTTQTLPPAYTLDHYRDLFARPDVFAPVAQSLWMAGAATALNVAFGLAAGWVLAKSLLPGRSVLRVLTALPFAIPGTVIALNLIVAFGGGSPLTAGQALTGTVWLLPLAYFVRNVPLAVRATSASLERYDDRLSEASADLGARAATTFRRVVLPIILPGVVAGALLVFVAALGEFVSSILLYTPQNRPIAVAIYDDYRVYDLGPAMAYGVLLMVLVAGASAATRWIGQEA